MIEIILFQLLRATVFLAVGFPIVWLLIRFGRLRSALGQRIAWGALLVVSLLCMTVPVEVPVAVESFEAVVGRTDPIPAWPMNVVQQMDEPSNGSTDHIATEFVFVADAPVVNDVVSVRNGGVGSTVSTKTFGTLGVFGVWITWTVLILGRRAFAFLTLQRILRSAQTIDDPQWSALLRSFHLSNEKIPLRLTESAGPALVREFSHGRLRLSLIVPETLWDELSPQLREGVLRHELGHYRHGDAVLSPLLFFLASLQWFNPFGWLALRRYDEATEWHADQFAYGSRETGSSELAETFLAIHRSTESIGLYLNSFSRFSTLGRVNRLLPGGGKESVMKKIVIGIVLTMLLCCGVMRVQIVAQSKETETLANSPEVGNYIDLNLMNTNCSIRMKKMQAALMDYHRETGRFPRPFTTDADGKPLHSWRVTIMPFLGEKELYDKIRKDEPWNSEYNKAFHSQCPDTYQCPFAVKMFPELKKRGLTTYALVVGKTAYPTTEDLILGKNFSDGTANTLAITERKSTACWMDPAGDIPQDEAGMGINISPNGIGMYHDNQSERTAAACFFNGTVHDFQENLHVPALQAFLTPNGGEALAIQYDDMVVIPDSQEPVFGVRNEENAEKLRKQNIELDVLYRFADGNWVNAKTEKVVTGVRLKTDDITMLLDKNHSSGRITAIRNDREMFSYHSTLFATTPKPSSGSGERKSSFDKMMESFSPEDATAVSVQPGASFNQDHEKKELDEVTGRVLDENGNPLEGVLVQIQSYVDDGAKNVPGKETKTDADGRFTLPGPFLITWGQQGGKVTFWPGPTFIFTRPGRERKAEMLGPKSNELNVTLNRGVSVQGRVVDDRTGKGASNVEVRFCSMTKPGGMWPEMMTKTDAEGNYRTEFTLPQDRYVLFVFNQRDSKDETVGKLEDINVTLDKPVFQAPDLHVNRCGWIEGTFVDAGTKEPVKVDSANIDHVCTSKTRHQMIFTQQAYLLVSGSQFKAKAFSGDNILRILGGRTNGQIKGLDRYCTKPIRVKPGETVPLQLEVMQAETAESLGKLPEPVEEEREAAEAVKRLGGWYKVDAEKHVVEVNMVYRDLDDVRYDNAQTGTDAVMAFLPKFSRLKLLLICNGQATNETAVHFSKLENLESLYFWDAKIDDQGAAHLSGLKKLRSVHLSDTGLTDASLEAFSKLPEIRELSLQGNRFTNRGLEFLRHAKTLEVLWWCRGGTRPDDESLKILAEFPNLKELEIQEAEVTAAGFASLSKAPALRKIWFSFPNDEKRPNHLRLSESLAKLKTLEYFGPDSLQFTPEEAKTLAKALPNLKELGRWDETQLKRLRESE